MERPPKITHDGRKRAVNSWQGSIQYIGPKTLLTPHAPLLLYFLPLFAFIYYLNSYFLSFTFSYFFSLLFQYFFSHILLPMRAFYLSGIFLHIRTQSSFSAHLYGLPWWALLIYNHLHPPTPAAVEYRSLAVQEAILEGTTHPQPSPPAHTHSSRL